MVLEISCLKKLKIKLLLSFLIVSCFLYCYYFLNINVASKYKLSDNEFIVKVIKINYKDNKTVIEGKGKEKVLINYKGEFKYQLGDKIKIIGHLREPSVNTNFNLFNYKHYLLSKKINYIVDATEVELVKKNNNIFYKIKNLIRNRLGENTYLNAFILGDNSYISSDVKNSYQLNGISHLFAVSGMHVSFIVGLLTFLFKNIKGNKLVVVIMLIFYAFLTNFSPSIMRSIIFFILCLIKSNCKWKIKTFELFLIMTISFLFVNPYYLYNIGFIYSFTISGFLIYFSDKLKGKNYFNSLIKISFISFLVSFPLTMYNNFSINLLSPLLNLFFVPFVSFIIFPFSFLVVLFPCLNFVYSFLTNILEQISLFFSSIDILNFIFAKPSILILLIYYLTIILIMKNRRYLYLLVVIIVIHYNIHFFNSDFKVTMLDIGQGDSILLEFPFNKGNILIDTGGKILDTSNYISNSIIIPYLKSIGIKKLDNLIITHGDYDHAGESINLVNNFNVEKVILNCGEFNELEEKLINALGNKKIPYYSCIKELNIDKYQLQFLNTEIYDNENDNSNVIYIKLDNYKFLFMGDAGIDKENDILEKYNLSNIDVLKVGHHGSKTGSGKDFINEMNPKYSIISVGENNRYGHPNNSVLDNLKQSKIYRTDQNGSILFEIKNNKLKIETCVP